MPESPANPAERDAEPCHFRDSACHERRFGIVAESHAVENARGDRKHVLEGSAEFHADDVA